MNSDAPLGESFPESGLDLGDSSIDSAQIRRRKSQPETATVSAGTPPLEALIIISDIQRYAFQIFDITDASLF